MSLEEVLKDPEKAFSFERDCSDEEWRQYGEKIIEVIVQSPKWSYRAGKIWSIERFDARFADAVAQSVEQSYHAGSYWLDEHFDARFADAVVQSPNWSYWAGVNWPDAHFDARFVDAVAQSPEHSYQAGKDWSDARFDDRIVATVVQDLELALDAIYLWPIDRAMQYRTQLFEAIKGSPEGVKENLAKAVIEYSGKTSQFACVLSNGRSDQVQNLKDFVGHGVDVAALYDVWEKVTMAYDIAKENHATEYFFENIKQVMESGDVKNWAQHIIETYRENATGGSNYREIFRGAAAK